MIAIIQNRYPGLLLALVVLVIGLKIVTARYEDELVAQGTLRTANLIVDATATVGSTLDVTGLITATGGIKGGSGARFETVNGVALYRSSDGGSNYWDMGYDSVSTGDWYLSSNAHAHVIDISSAAPANALVISVTGATLPGTLAVSGDTTVGVANAGAGLTVNTVSGKTLTVSGVANGLSDGILKVVSNKTTWGNITGQLRTTAGGSTSTDNLTISIDSGAINFSTGGLTNALTLSHAGLATLAGGFASNASSTMGSSATSQTQIINGATTINGPGGGSTNASLDLRASYDQTVANTGQLRVSESGSYRGSFGYDEAGGTNFVFDNSFNDATAEIDFRFGNTTNGAKLFGNGNWTTNGGTTSSFGHFSADVAVGTTLTMSGHRIANGTAPTVSACGVAGTVQPKGDDGDAYFTTGTVSTTCTYTFAVAYTNKPACQVWPESSATLPTVAVAADKLTFAVDIAATTYHVHCVDPNR